MLSVVQWTSLAGVLKLPGVSNAFEDYTIKPLNEKIKIINSLLCWSVILLMFIQTLDHSWNWKSGNRLAVNKWFWNFFFEGLAKGLRMLRSSWILNQCNLFCKIVKYCILKTVPHSYCLTSYAMYKWYKRLVYTYPALMARLCKVKLSNAKNSACFFFHA